jgi:hypothetical protein
MGSSAQGDGSGRVRAMRVDFLNKKLNLGTEQSSQFWAVYNRYLNERSELRKIYKDQFRKNSGKDLSKYQANRFVDDNIEYKERDLALSKKYKNELLKVINAQQLADLYQYEREFKQMLIQTLKDRD